MKTNILFVFTLIILTLFFSCDKLWPPEEPNVTTTKDDVLNFQMIISDSGSIIFKNSDDLLLNNKDVDEIVLIDKDGEIFEDLKIIEPNYTKTGNKYLLEFEITTLAAPETYIKHYALKFNMVDASYLEIDKIANLYKYPYENAEIFINPEEVATLENGLFIQDFDIVDNHLYYHPYGPVGLYRYNLSTRSSSELLWGYASGDNIATDGNYVFVDFQHSRIQRYSTISDTIDLSFDLTQVSWATCDYTCSNLSIYGLAAHGNILYTTLHNQDTNKSFLVQFDYDGNLLSEANYPLSSSINLEFYDDALYSYAYSVDTQTYNINCLDLNTMALLDPKKAPTPSPDGISITNGRFYYTDYYRGAIFSIPISDLMD